jgi:dimethylargininase
VLLALTREISPNLGRCELTHLKPQTIDIALAQEQHRHYEKCLASLGCEVRRLQALPELPDSVFVEDTCVVLDELAIITRPGALSRRPETESVGRELRALRSVSFLTEPGTLDGGDVLRLGKRLFVGQSSRTNEAGIGQLSHLVTPAGYEVHGVPVTDCLHLKSAVTQVANGVILINPSWVDPSHFGNVKVIEVDPSEPFAANALLIKQTVLYPDAFPLTRQRLEDKGIAVMTLDLSELAKAEGAVTCCSVICEAE